jgi:3-oxoacyl-[acyl-carrier protein] reductase
MTEHSMTEHSHAGRVAVITGGAGGIGRAVAAELARRGARIALLDSNPDVLSVTHELTLASGEATGHCANVADPDSVSRAIEEVLAAHHSADILVNCAGIVVRRDNRKIPAAEMTIAEWQRGIDVNLTGVFLCARAVLPAMKAANWGRIITLSSQGGRTGGVFSSVDYGAAKAGVIGFSRTLATEVGKFGVTVNCLAPGRVSTSMTGNPLESAQNDAWIAGLPIPRMGTAGEVASAVAFLSTDAAGYITGTTIDINGGGFMA